MATYTGMHGQVRKNNFRSILLLLGFPILLLAAVYAFFFFMAYSAEYNNLDEVHGAYFSSVPYIIIGTAIWFLIAFFAHTKMINAATGSRPLERKENKRVYNLVENLTIATGMKMPKVNVIPDPALNAFASGINEKTYTVTLTQGIMEKLNDEELEGVIAHELMHIRNKDVRLLIISIIFVGIFSFVAQILFRNMLWGGMGRRRRGKDEGKAILVAMVIAMIAYLLSMVFRFAISRKREYMADAGAAEMTKNPLALASALRKISGNYRVSTVKSDDVAEMFIENRPAEGEKGLMSAITGLFATHPPIEERIRILEQF